MVVGAWFLVVLCWFFSYNLLLMNYYFSYIYYYCCYCCLFFFLVFYCGAIRMLLSCAACLQFLSFSSFFFLAFDDATKTVKMATLIKKTRTRTTRGTMWIEKIKSNFLAFFVSFGFLSFSRSFSLSLSLFAQCISLIHCRRPRPRHRLLVRRLISIPAVFTWM